MGSVFDGGVNWVSVDTSGKRKSFCLSIFCCGFLWLFSGTVCQLAADQTPEHSLFSSGGSCEAWEDSDA